jgi:hypothetical protein
MGWYCCWSQSSELRQHTQQHEQVREEQLPKENSANAHDDQPERYQNKRRWVLQSCFTQPWTGNLKTKYVTKQAILFIYLQIFQTTYSLYAVLCSMIGKIKCVRGVLMFFLNDEEDFFNVVKDILNLFFKIRAEKCSSKHENK